MTSSRVTIRQVAEQAGVSLASVSSALNGRPGMVSAQTQARIVAVAEKIGYRPSRKARQLRQQGHLTLSVQIDSNAVASLTSRQTMALSMLVLQGISAYALRQGYHLHLLMPRPGQDAEAFEEQVVRENAVDGMVFLGYNLQSLTDSQLQAMLGQLKTLGLPAVTLNHRVAAQGVPAVLTNLESAIGQMARRIAEHGHRRAGYIGLSRRVGHELRGRSRFELFENALDDAGVTIDPACIRETGLEVHAYRETLAMIDAGHCPSCLIYSADHLAIAGMQAMEDRGLQPGRDLAVIGSDHAPYAQGLPIELATIDQRFIDRGELMAKLLIDQIRHPTDPVPEYSIVDALFVDGPSLGPCPNFSR